MEVINVVATCDFGGQSYTVDMWVECTHIYM